MNGWHYKTEKKARKLGLKHYPFCSLSGEGFVTTANLLLFVFPQLVVLFEY